MTFVLGALLSFAVLLCAVFASVVVVDRMFLSRVSPGTRASIRRVLPWAKRVAAVAIIAIAGVQIAFLLTR